MAESDWQYSSDTWEKREEQLTPTIVMLCYRRPVGIEYDSDVPDRMWVLVRRANSETNSALVESFPIEPSCPITLECIAHEMRKKYKGGA